MLLMDIFEARDPKKTYHFTEVKGKVDKIIVKLEGSESGVWTKMGRRYKEIDIELKKLQAERDGMNEKIKTDMLDNYFDAEDTVLTRIVETVSLTAQLAKVSPPSPKVDNDKVMEKLLTLMPELKDKIVELQKEFTSMPAARSPALTIKTEAVGDVWEKFKAKLAKFLDGIKSWGTKYDAKLAEVKMMMKPSRQVSEDLPQHLASRMQTVTVPNSQILAKKFIQNLKDAVAKDGSTLTQDDVDGIVKDLSGKDGDLSLSLRDITMLPTFKKSKNQKAFLDAAGLATESVMEAGEVAVRDPRTPIDRDADYIKKVSGLKVGTIAVKRYNAAANLYIGDWVRVTKKDDKNFNKFGYIVSKEFESDEDYNGPAGGGKIWKLKIDISTDSKPELIELTPGAGEFGRVKKWKEVDGLVNTVGGAAGAKAKADTEKANAKAAAKTSSTQMETSVPSNVYGDSTAQPNLNFPTGGKPLHVDETKPRTAEEKKAAKDMIKVLEADLKIHKAFVAANPSPRDKDRAQVLKNSERIIEAFKKTDKALDDYISCIKILNKEANSGDRELFKEARDELGRTISPLYEDLKTIKLKASIPKYVSRARVLAAVAIDTMYAEEKKVDAWAKRRDWSKEKLAAAKKTSERMKLAWSE